LQERKSAICQNQKQAKTSQKYTKSARVQGRNWGTAEVTAGVTAEAWQKKILLYARKCVIMVIDIINKRCLFLLVQKKQLPTL